VGTTLRARPIEEKIALARACEAGLVPLLASGRVRRVVDRVLPFSAIRAAHEAMERNESFGKIVLRW
jgi:NADPH:quinone reductase-like Zn-dependent oxidoreductase